MPKTQAAHKPALKVLADCFAICRLNADATLPPQVLRQTFFSITRTPDELSLVLPEAAAPAGDQTSTGWRCLQLAAPLDFGLVGVLAGISGCLAQAGISLFTISTYDTDYIFIQQADLESACAALKTGGYALNG